MKALVSLGHTSIPRILTAATNAHLAALPNINSREVWTIHREWKGCPERHANRYLNEAFMPFLEEKLKALGASVCHSDQSLVVFRNVGLHNDDENYINRRAAGFFHIILRGKGTLRIPGARNPAMRQLKLERGLMFFMNPRAKHMVVDASSGPIVSLTVTVLPPPSCM